MLNTILGKRARVLALILVLSVLLTAATAFAATVFIRAKRGGRVNIAEGVELVIPPRALAEDTFISAYVRQRWDRVIFYFGPDGTEFSKPANLYISWQAVRRAGVEDFTLYGPGGLKIEPTVKGWGLKYEIDHFSLYYYRRR
jgi:hypothetical protein